MRLERRVSKKSSRPEIETLHFLFRVSRCRISIRVPRETEWNPDVREWAETITLVSNLPFCDDDGDGDAGDVKIRVMVRIIMFNQETLQMHVHIHIPVRRS